MAVIGKGDLAKQLARKMDVPATQANKTLGSVLDTIAELLGSGEEVRLTGFGTFRVLQTKERPGRNPQTGAPLTIKAGRRVSFSASPHLLEGAGEAKK